MGSREDHDVRLVTTTKSDVVQRQASLERMGEQLLLPALPSKPADLPTLILEPPFSKEGVEQNFTMEGLHLANPT